MPVKYCVNLPIGGQAAYPRTLAGYAAAAGEARWDAVFVEDNLLYQNRQDPPTIRGWRPRWRCHVADLAGAPCGGQIWEGGANAREA
jgi:hypothetical protein